MKTLVALHVTLNITLGSLKYSDKMSEVISYRLITLLHLDERNYGDVELFYI